MSKEKKSFFERLAGSVMVEDNDPEEEELEVEIGRSNKKFNEAERTISNIQPEEEYEEGDGELSVDVYQTPNEIIIEAMLAGVKPEDLQISITRDMVTIKGRRDGNTQISEDDYFYRELYWGSFSRSILLPHEIEIENVEAVEKHGLLIIRLPKIDKARQAKIKVKSIKLDTWMKQFNHKYINFIWADINGAEEDLILGGLNTLRDNTKFLYIETSDKELYEGEINKQRLLELLPEFELIDTFNDLGNFCNILLKNKNL